MGKEKGEQEKSGWILDGESCGENEFVNGYGLNSEEWRLSSRVWPRFGYDKERRKYL